VQKELIETLTTDRTTPKLVKTQSELRWKTSTDSWNVDS
jgi:hypothetical protein